MKLSKQQIKVIQILRKYPNDIIMHNGWLTGGHGIKFDMRTVESLKDRGIIERFGERAGSISEFGKNIKLD